MRTFTLRDLQTKGAFIPEGQLEGILVEGSRTAFFLALVQKGLEPFQAGLLARAQA